jgi:hypothetical protein
MKFDTSAVLTSCNRPDLLQKTLDSFFDKNTYPIAKFIIIDDSLVDGCNDFVHTRYDFPITTLYNTTKIGQVRSIDVAYSQVNTEFVFHMEEDWEFLLKSPIEVSRELMEEDGKIITAWLRSPNDVTLNHTYSKETYISKGGIQYKRCDVYYPRGMWNGFTFNPSLKRMRDYDLVRPYQQLPRITPAKQAGINPLECDVSVAYAQLGYYAVTTLDQYIEHIGWGRHVPD